MEAVQVLCLQASMVSELFPAEKEIEILALWLTLAGSFFLSLLEETSAE
ncbi:hypothetical protein [Obesumbacterium proteus]|nr:hypothetical protein [Obesumbacterium proteus]